MRKRLTQMGIIFISIFLVIAFAYVPIGNNIILMKYTRHLKITKLNADYEILAIDSKCGKLIGNGNGMQYFSALLIHTEDTLTWENRDMEGVFLLSINDDEFIEFMDQDGLGRWNKNIKKRMNTIQDTINYYVLYSFYSAGLDDIWNNDLRAH